MLRAGGIPQMGNRWDLYSSWFCNTNSLVLNKVSITWRAGRYFRMHWGNEKRIGLNRAQNYMEIPLKEFRDNFDRYYNLLNIGDVIQYGKYNNNYFPYHTQVIHKKEYNPRISKMDLFIAQHSPNSKNVSLRDYLDKFDKDDILIYIYIIA